MHAIVSALFVKSVKVVRSVSLSLSSLLFSQRERENSRQQETILQFPVWFDLTGWILSVCPSRTESEKKSKKGM